MARGQHDQVGGQVEPHEVGDRDVVPAGEGQRAAVRPGTADHAVGGEVDDPRGTGRTGDRGRGRRLAEQRVDTELGGDGAGLGVRTGQR